MKLFARLLFVFWLVTACCFAQSAAPVSHDRKTLTIESIFAEGGITGRAPETIEWSPDNSKVSYVQRDDSGEHGELWYVAPATGERHLLVSESKLASLSPPASSIKDEREKERITRYHVAAYLWSPDSQNLLFDSKGQLWLYSLDSSVAIQFTTNPEPKIDPKFSPDGRNLAYIRKHNLYVRTVKGEDERQLTKRDKDDKDKDDNLLNGEVDWVYAEELGVRSNYFWSPDGKDLVFLQMDESQVPTYPITDWLPTHPKADEQKYPKAGDHNPSVRLGVVSASGGKTKWISLGENPDVYVPRFGWVRDGLIWAEVLNRTQDKLDLYFVDARSGKSHKALSETAPDAWVNVNDDVKFLKASNRFTWSSWRDGNTHLYLYSYDGQNPLAGDAKLERQLTQGDFQVLGLQAIDESAGVAYFICNKGDPRQRQLYSVKLDGSDFKPISTTDGTHAVEFSDDAKHYVDNSSATSTPPAMAVCSPGGPCQRFWESRSVSEFGLAAPKFLQFRAGDGTTLYGQVLLPPEGAGTDKIPVIVHVYGGPEGQLVVNEWGGGTGLFHQMLAQQGYAIFSVDNRGTPARDRKFHAAIRHQFGAIELKDQLAALDQLFAQYPQLDRSRVAIWGWSNGGFMTLYAMEHSDVFKAGVSVAPVTDWHNYDSTYTERYMGLPKDNASGYEQSSTPKAADKLHGALLLVHGTSDDNVHFQNSIQMVEGLIKAGKQFRFMPYPNKTHGIAGPVDRDHLFHMIQDFFDKELK